MTWWGWLLLLGWILLAAIGLAVCLHRSEDDRET